MYTWEYESLKKSLERLQSTLQFSYENDHNTLLKAIKELNTIINSLENFCVHSEQAYFLITVNNKRYILIQKFNSYKEAYQQMRTELLSVMLCNNFQQVAFKLGWACYPYEAHYWANPDNILDWKIIEGGEN